MALVHFWTPHFQTRIAVSVADIRRVIMRLNPVIDPADGQTTVHPATDVCGVIIHPNLDLAFNPLETILAVEQLPEFAFVPYTYTEAAGVARIAAVPQADHLRRSVYPDWYIPGHGQEAAR